MSPKTTPSAARTREAKYPRPFSTGRLGAGEFMQSFRGSLVDQLQLVFKNQAEHGPLQHYKRFPILHD